MSDELKDAPEYMDYARRVLRTAKLAYDDGDWVSAINRAYEAFESRQEGDYERSEFPAQEDARAAVERAERFVARIEKFLSEP